MLDFAAEALGVSDGHRKRLTFVIELLLPPPKGTTRYIGSFHVICTVFAIF